MQGRLKLYLSLQNLLKPQPRLHLSGQQPEWNTALAPLALRLDAVTHSAQPLTSALPAASFLETQSASVGRPANCCLILYLGQLVTYFLLG
ncbi:hypothetical protein FQN60_015803, partial [Etheostoma spectabile]